MSEKGVAPHAGSVDRNTTSCARLALYHWSLPTRGAWIEIYGYENLHYQPESRSPRGERG